jgi:DNA topoisomerase-3
MSEFKVYIAEKPSVGKALAEGLARRRSPQTGRTSTSIEGRDWAVCWLSGHVFEQVGPDHYIGEIYPGARKNDKGKFPWSFDTLPILPRPEQWKLLPVRGKGDLITTVRDLVKRASVVVHAGDIDREGQLLVDEVLEDIKCRKPVRRILPKAIDDKSIDKALGDERDNRDFAPMRDAALARSRSDWLVGMNFSRGVTLRARECGSDGLVTIGRVQTPILGLIVARELEIQNFKPVDYFALTAVIGVQQGRFRARWKPRAGQPGLDEDGRLLDPGVASQIQQQVAGKIGAIADYRDEAKTQGPPLPFSIDELQKLASRKYGMPLDRTLATVQSLYETHKAVTYPRSDCSFLPTSQHADAPDILSAVRSNFGSTELPAVAADASSQRRSRAFDDKKVTAHHAIVPTSQHINLARLSHDEKVIYEEICRRYLAQFMPLHEYRQVSVRAEVAGHDFVATGRTTLKPGWRALYQRAATQSDDEMPENDNEEGITLPPMRNGEPARCEGLDKDAKKTTPPLRFNDATLLEAMVNIHKFVEAPKIKAHFLEKIEKSKTAGADDEAAGVGIGTPATRHTFVPKLIEVELVQVVQAAGNGKRGKQMSYMPTSAGMALVQALPRQLTVPDTTAVWDMAFGKIEAREITLEQFMASQERTIVNRLDEVRKAQIQLPESKRPRSASSGKKKAQAAAKSGNGAGLSAGPCEKCGKGEMRRRQSAKGEFYGCSNYPVCKHTRPA